MTTVRTEPRHYGASSRDTKHCSRPGCYSSTREGKPYCPEHVEEHPYVQALLHTLQEQEQEQEQASKRGGKRYIDRNGLTVREIVNHLNMNGSRTIPRLCRELQLDEPLMLIYGEYLVEQNIVTMSNTVRGTPVLSLKESA